LDRAGFSGEFLLFPNGPWCDLPGPRCHNDAVDLEAFELVLLRTPENAPVYDDAELARIQAEHLAYHARLRASGQVVTNGPVRDQPDVSLRGLTFYRTGSLEEARKLAEADPAVRAGRLAVEIMTWYCPPGTMSQPGRAVTL
jgi:uncharacterized protein